MESIAANGITLHSLSFSLSNKWAITLSKDQSTHVNTDTLTNYISETVCKTTFFYPRVALNIWISVKEFVNWKTVKIKDGTMFQDTTLEFASSD